MRPISLGEYPTLDGRAQLGASRLPSRGFAWLHQYQRLRIRYERRADIHRAPLHLTCTLIYYRRLETLIMK